MSETVHSYIRKRGSTDAEPVELSYHATGRHLQEDVQALTANGLPKPDLLRGIVRCASRAEASRVAALKLHGLYTKEVEVDAADTFYQHHPELVGPPRIQLRAPRPRPPAPPTRRDT